jgi:O-antigen biosynthesis protein
MSDKLSLIAILRESVRNPRLLFLMLNRRNARILLKAIRQENFKTIIQNFGQALLRLNSVIQAGNRSGSESIWQVERSDLISQRYLFLRGWMISPLKISGCRFVADGQPERPLLLGPVRDEIKEVYWYCKGWDHKSFRKVIDLGPEADQGLDQIMLRFDLEPGQLDISVSIQPLDSQTDMDLDDQYQIFQLQNQTTPGDLALKQDRSGKFRYRPLISIITPVYNVKSQWLDRCIESVRNQVYDHWELCLYDDKSTNQATIQCLAGWQNKDPRIRIRLGARNQNISAASNEAIKMATGEFVGLLDHDDELTPDALYEVVKVLNDQPDADLIYSDEDKLELDGTFTRPHFKPDFNLDLLRSNNYICHFTVIRKSVGDRVGWFTPGLEGSQDHDLILKVVDATTEDKIIHIPKVLYHWRRIPGSTAESYNSKHYAFEAGRLAVERHLKRKHWPAQVVKSEYAGLYRVVWNLDSSRMVTIIIPFRDQVELLKQCVTSILEKTNYPAYEILLVNNNSREDNTFRYLDELCQRYPNIRSMEWNKPFNYSALNNDAVQLVNTEYVLFLNSDTEVINDDWLTEMMRHGQRPDVGAVGAKLYYPDGTLQHAGIIVGLGGAAASILDGSDGLTFGYQGRGVVTHNLSACTGACLLVKRQVFLEIGGFDATNLVVSYNDVDLCLRLNEKGYRIVFNPYTRLVHHVSATRTTNHLETGDQDFIRERDYFRTRWKHFLNDPFYNPNLALDKADFSLRI